MALRFVAILAVVLITVGTLITIAAVDVLKALGALFRPWTK